MKIKKVIHYRLDIIFKNARGRAKSIQNMWIVVDFFLQKNEQCQILQDSKTWSYKHDLNTQIKNLY